MTIEEHIITTLGEEGAEISQQCSKANRFGLDDVNIKVPDGPDNRRRLVVELNQLVAMADLAANAGLIPKDWMSSPDSLQIRREKFEAFETYLNYSDTKGRVTR